MARKSVAAGNGLCYDWKKKEKREKALFPNCLMTEAAVVFSSMTFLLLFLPIVLLLYFSVSSLRWKNAVLLIVSLLFYAWGEPVCVLAMLFTTAVNYLCAAAIAKTDDPRRRKAALAFGVGVSLALLFYFKYFSFALDNLAALFSLPLSVPQIRLPIGISFYTFQVLTYTVDVYRGKTPAQKSFPRLLLYVSCFPQLIAGPIVQYADVASQLDARSVSLKDFNEGFERFVVGLAKKVLLANLCGAAVEALPNGGAASLLGAWYHAFLYTLQIYFDFSAYSDMAIGLGRVLGFRYKENFNYPYVSLSATEFWRRWHISLGSFFRDYVYIPLGGNRRGAVRTALNLLIVWGLTGLWHGAAWNFLLWGLYFGVLLILERFALKRVIEKTPKAIRWALTFVIAVVGWAIFYETDLAALGATLRTLFGLAGVPLLDETARKVIAQYSVFPLLAFLCSLPVVPAVKKALLGRRGGKKRIFLVRAVSMALLFALSIVFLVGQSYNPFIYFRF
ncbi:MAG: MBOAT family protein [Oscillospiraceae bacterium]|nr:MBOAT family protein [Oscillospiraceae bacterium]